MSFFLIAGHSVLFDVASWRTGWELCYAENHKSSQLFDLDMLLDGSLLRV